MENKDIQELQAGMRQMYDLNKAMASELTALRSLVRAIAIQPVFDREILVMSATTLLDAAIAEIPPDLQSAKTLDQAQAFLDGLLYPSVD